jgi:hypothetical protein
MSISFRFCPTHRLRHEKNGAWCLQGLGGGDVIYFHTVTVRVVIQEQTWQFNCEVGFADSLNKMSVGFLGRRGFFELFEEIVFNQRRREFRLKLDDEDV